MLDHITLNVKDAHRSRAFYDRALAPLEVRVLVDIPATKDSETVLAYGEGKRAYFWLAQASPVSGPLHISFAAETRAQVVAFYEAAIAAGGVDNGKPGPRPHYGPTYYGAFIIDPDGHNIEAVCRRAES